ncbi:MAG: M81 family metallopeptidase [Acidobacteria bacterium]|nr:M81 family metallopeptidase [Acidobacteriota bacterium]
MPRILISECKQEISSFNPVVAGYDDFLINRGDDVITYHTPVRSEVGGALNVFATRPDYELAGGYCARGITSTGTVSSTAFAKIAEEFLDAVRNAGAIDGIYYSLHGALAAEDVDDCEGYLLEKTREIVGEKMPIAASFDLHGILTDRMLQHPDVVTVFHTNPHTDFFQTGQRAARLLIRLLDGEIRPVQIRIPVPALVRGQECITATGRYGKWVKQAIDFENSPGGLSGGFFIGNPFTDVPDLASNVFLEADGDEGAAIELGTRMAKEFWEARAQIQQPLLNLEHACRIAIAAKGRIVLVDAADATSSGASGDSNAIVAELVRQGCTRTVLAPCVDAPAARACMTAGIGAEITVTIGGSLDPRFKPLAVTGRVRVLSDGHMRSESHGEHWYAGPTGVLESGPFTWVLMSRPVSLYDRTPFLVNGQDPANFDMCVVKSPLCQPRFFNDLAEHVLNIDAPGATSANVKGLGHKVARRPLYPLDDNFWKGPEVRVFRRH